MVVWLGEVEGDSNDNMCGHGRGGTVSYWWGVGMCSSLKAGKGSGANGRPGKEKTSPVPNPIYRGALRALLLVRLLPRGHRRLPLPLPHQRKSQKSNHFPFTLSALSLIKGKALSYTYVWFPPNFFESGFIALSLTVAKSGIKPMYQKTNETEKYVDIANTSHKSGELKLGHKDPN